MPVSVGAGTKSINFNEKKKKKNTHNIQHKPSEKRFFLATRYSPSSDAYQPFLWTPNVTDHRSMRRERMWWISFTAGNSVDGPGESHLELQPTATPAPSPAKSGSWRATK